MEKRRVNIAVDPEFRKWLKIEATKRGMDMTALSKRIAEDNFFEEIETKGKKREKNIYF